MQSEGTGVAVQFQPDRAGIQFEGNLLLGHQLIGAALQFGNQAQRPPTEPPGFLQAEFHSPAFTAHQHREWRALGIETEAPAGALLNLQSQPGNRAG